MPRFDQASMAQRAGGRRRGGIWGGGANTMAASSPGGVAGTKPMPAIGGGDIGAAINAVRGQLGGGLPPSALPGLEKPMPRPGGMPFPGANGPRLAIDRLPDVLPQGPEAPPASGPPMMPGAQGAVPPPRRYMDIAQRFGPEVAAARWQAFQSGQLPGQQAQAQPQGDQLQPMVSDGLQGPPQLSTELPMAPDQVAMEKPMVGPQGIQNAMARLGQGGPMAISSAPGGQGIPQQQNVMARRQAANERLQQLMQQVLGGRGGGLQY